MKFMLHLKISLGCEQGLLLFYGSSQILQIKFVINLWDIE